jgi:Xaa-Pro aminopeptidase
MSYKAYERLLLPANKHFTSFNMQELRATKNTEEIAAIRKACELAADCED